MRHLLRQEHEFQQRLLDAERAWREQERRARADEAARVERRHQQDARDADRRFVWGIVATVSAVVVGQLMASWIRSWNSASRPAAPPAMPTEDSPAALPSAE